MNNKKLTHPLPLNCLAVFFVLARFLLFFRKEKNSQLVVYLICPHPFPLTRGNVEQSDVDI